MSRYGKEIVEFTEEVWPDFITESIEDAKTYLDRRRLFANIMGLQSYASRVDLIKEFIRLLD